MNERAKWKIQFLRRLQNELETKVDDIVDECIGEGIYMTGEGLPDNAQWFKVSIEWDCPDSPFGWCMYHIIRDRACDGCVFCGQPKERK